MPLLKILVLFVSCSICSSALAQGEAEQESENINQKTFWSFEMEMIFSLAQLETPNDIFYDQNLRWSPVLNLAYHFNYNPNDFLGFNAGIAMRNVGFIVKDDELGEAEFIDRIKYRTYNAGLPVGFKIGRLDQSRPLFFFGGYEFEIPFHYKEKQFSGDDKESKTTDWFSKRNTDFQHSVWAGFQFPQGFSIKAKYYLTEFFNSDYTERISSPDGEILRKPFQNFNANIYYLSISWFPFQDVNYALSKVKK
jgi:hypothetical protein